MRYPISKTIAATAIAVVLFAGACTAAVPAVRHIASGWWNNPEHMVALPENAQLHYEHGGSDAARAVAEVLPAAIARIEAIHGRRFAHPVTIGVYISDESFAAANGSGNSKPAGMMFMGRVLLAPALFANQRQRLPAILTHELSHAHIRSWVSELTYMRLPHWFKEGLGVMVSRGGGAEGVSEHEAREAILRGDRIAIESAGTLLNLRGVKFEHPAEPPNTSFRTQLAYRQAGLFVAFLHDTDPAGFARMMNAILDGRSLTEAVKAGYGTDLQTLWSRFAHGA